MGELRLFAGSGRDGNRRMRKFKVTTERRDTYREHFFVEAETREEAEAKAEEASVEYDWTENEVMHGDETIVAVRQVE